MNTPQTLKFKGEYYAYSSAFGAHVGSKIYP